MTLKALVEAKSDETDCARATVGIINATAVRGGRDASLGLTDQPRIAVGINRALSSVRIGRDTGTSVAETIRAPVRSLAVGIGGALKVWVGGDASTSVAEGRGSVTVGVGGALVGARSADSINAEVPGCGAVRVDGTPLWAGVSLTNTRVSVADGRGIVALEVGQAPKLAEAQSVARRLECSE